MNELLEGTKVKTYPDSGEIGMFLCIFLATLLLGMAAYTHEHVNHLRSWCVVSVPMEVLYRPMAFTAKSVSKLEKVTKVGLPLT